VSDGVEWGEKGENAMRRLSGLRITRLALLCLAVARLATAGDVLPSAADSTQIRNEEKPPVLSKEIKELLDGFIAIQHSDTLMFDQRGIEETLRIAMVNRRASKAYARFELTGLPPHLSGKYELGSTFANSLEAELRIVFDTHRVCAHLPQVLEYIGKPYVRRLILFSPGPDNDPQPRPAWPGVESSVWLKYHFVGDNPSKIKPHFSLIIQGIECVRIVQLESLLKKPEEWK